MEVYQFFLKLDNLGFPGKTWSKIVRCADPNKDGLERFINDINAAKRFLPVEKDITYKKL